MRQRLKLAQAIVHDPEIVFLDEPTNGLDPRGREQILELIQSLWTEHGISVVLSSHLLHDVQRICDQIIIVALGKVLIHDTIANLSAQCKGSAEVVVANDQQKLVRLFKAEGWPSENLPNGHLKVEHGGLDINPILEIMHRAGITPIEVLPSPNALEEFFIQALNTAHESVS